MHGGQSATLPESPEDRAELASRLGIEQDLLEYVDEHRAKVHPIYEGIYQETREASP